MKMTPFVGRLLLLTTWVGVSLLPAIYGAVTELDDSNFYDYAKDKDVLLVDFYAPWCPDCKNLDPDFAEAASKLGRRSADLARVDCFGAGKGLCSKYGVKRWPTLKNFNRGQYTGDYEGGLSADEISGYVNTVENSAGAFSNPYAAPYTPMAVATQQCVSRCKISNVPNKTPCFARCKAAKPAGKLLPQPVINEKSCAKCRQPQIAGKFTSYCSVIEEGCRKLNEVEHTQLLPLTPMPILKMMFGNKKKNSTVSEVGLSGLPRQTEHIMKGYIDKPNLVTEFIKRKNFGAADGVPRLTKQAPYEDSDGEYEKVAGENTFMQKGHISHGHSHGKHRHTNKFLDSMSPREALGVPYDNGDKKQKVAEGPKVFRGRLSLNDVYVDGVSIFGSIP